MVDDIVNREVNIILECIIKNNKVGVEIEIMVRLFVVFLEE